MYYIYLFREKETGNVIYVGSTMYISNRLNEHRRAFREEKHELPIHTYMKGKNLKLFDDVEVCIVKELPNSTKEEVLKVEAEYYFKYKDTVKNTRPAEIRTGVYSTQSKPVICTNDEKTFVSIREASEFYGLNRVTIMNHLNKGSVLKNGLVFRYLNDSDNKINPTYRIYCETDDKYFSTFKSCSEAYDIPSYTMYNLMKDNVIEFDFQGRHFRRCNDYRKHYVKHNS